MEVDLVTPVLISQLAEDGIIWMAYPKKTSKSYHADIQRDHGWDSLLQAGFKGVRQIAIDEDWSALRFRDRRFVN